VPSVLHKFNVPVLSHSSRSGLSSVWHDGNLLVGVLVSQGNGGGDWIEVRCCIISIGDSVVLSVPEFLLVHIKTISINVEGFIAVISIKELPVNNYIFASVLIILLLIESFVVVAIVVSVRNFVKGNLELHEL